MKALILAGGRGSRIERVSNDVNKCMIEINDRPVIEYNLDRACDIDDVEEIIIVVGYNAEDIINRYGTSYKNKKIKYVIQNEQKGLVHAIECSIDAIGADDFFLLLGDEVLINSRHKAMYKQFNKEKLFGMCGVVSQEDKKKISKTYGVISDEENRVFRLIEKPKKPVNNLQGTGHCLFRNEIISFIERTPIHPERGEKELPDLIQCAIDDGEIIKIFNICDKYTNINSLEDLNEAKKSNIINS